MALENLGIAELWSGRLDHARRHLEDSLVLSGRADRPWLQIAAHGHLGIAVPWAGEPIPAGLARSDEAVGIAPLHGWDEDPVIGHRGNVVAVDDAAEWLDRSRTRLAAGR